MSLDWALINQQLQRWVVRGSGLTTDQVRFAQQAGERPPQPGITMFVRRVDDLGELTVDAVPNPLVISPLTITAVSPSANTLTHVGHGLVTGDGPFTLASTGTLPGGAPAAPWVVVVDANTLKLAATYQDTGGNDLSNTNPITTVDLSTAGTGTITLASNADTLRAGEEVLMTSRIPKRIRLQLECYTSPGVGMNMALAVLQRVATRAPLPGQLALLDVANIGFNYCDYVRAVRGTVGAVMFEPRAVMEVIMNLADEETEPGAIIRSAGVTFTPTSRTFVVDGDPAP